MQLHYYPSTAAMIPHILLEELGIPYERVLVDRTQNRHKEPAYLALNPNGLIPVLTDGDLVLYETAAIVRPAEHPAAHAQTSFVVDDVRTRARVPSDSNA